MCFNLCVAWFPHTWWAFSRNLLECTFSEPETGAQFQIFILEVSQWPLKLWFCKVQTWRFVICHQKHKISLAINLSWCTPLMSSFLPIKWPQAYPTSFSPLPVSTAPTTSCSQSHLRLSPEGPRTAGPCSERRWGSESGLNLAGALVSSSAMGKMTSSPPTSLSLCGRKWVIMGENAFVNCQALPRVNAESLRQIDLKHVL